MIKGVNFNDDFIANLDKFLKEHAAPFTKPNRSAFLQEAAIEKMVRIEEQEHKK